MPHSAAAIANYFIERALREGVRLSPMKLQKLVYCAHGWHLAITGQPLLDESIEAWRYGPVINSLYHEFKDLGNQPIRRRASRFDPERFRYVTPSIEEEPDESLETTRSILDRTWHVYRPFSAVQLSSMAHRKGTPWDVVMSSATDKEPVANRIIPNELIQEHFIELGESKRKASA